MSESVWWSPSRNSVKVVLRLRKMESGMLGGQPTKGLVKRIVLHQHGCLTTAAQTTEQESVNKQYIAVKERVM